MLLVDVPLSRDGQRLIAAAIANARGMRRGMPPIVNVLDLVPPDVLAELLDDALSVQKALLTCTLSVADLDELKRPGFPRERPPMAIPHYTYFSVTVNDVAIFGGKCPMCAAALQANVKHECSNPAPAASATPPPTKRKRKKQ